MNWFLYYNSLRRERVNCTSYIFSAEFVRMWSIREEVFHVTRVGQVIDCFKENN